MKTVLSALFYLSGSLAAGLLFLHAAQVLQRLWVMLRFHGPVW